MNPYEILEVSPKASAEVIRAAYKSLMQRTHPDKSPADAAMAARAAQIVQAYELLSDPDRRLAYDRQLALELRASAVAQYERSQIDGRNPARARALKVPEQAESNQRWVWFAGLILAVILFSGWSIATMLKKDLSSESTSVSSPALSKRQIPELLRDVTVRLKNPDDPLAESGIVLFIPVIGVRVGSTDAENAIRHLNNTKARLDRKLREALASASYPDLIKADGERYLSRMILDTLNEKPDEAKDAPLDDYGVVDVLLPESYSVK